MCDYADLLMTGYNVKMDKQKAENLYTMAADKGSIYALNAYINIVSETSIKHRYDIDHYYMMAIEKGNAQAMNNYAIRKYHHNDIFEAVRYFKMAAERGNVAAMVNYANMLYTGDHVKANKEEAIRYLKKAIARNDSNAMNTYGVMLKKGEPLL